MLIANPGGSLMEFSCTFNRDPAAVSNTNETQISRTTKILRLIDVPLQPACQSVGAVCDRAYRNGTFFAASNAGPWNSNFLTTAQKRRSLWFSTRATKLSG